MYLTVFSSILDGSKKLCKVFAKFLQSFCKVFKNFANYHKPTGAELFLGDVSGLT